MRSLLLLFFIACSFSLHANENPGKIYVNLQKLHSLKRVLYVAAHPDDENTRALAWFSLGEKAETAYFSLTRGDGGQNLIGEELGAELGVLRTQELLAARSYDGAKQYFSHAVDFGYSKSAEESFQKWGREILLEDLVLMIRMFQPDVIVTRFPPDERAGHGHHTASAELAIEAFEKAADPSVYANQLTDYDVWQTTSIYWNTSYWWDKDIREYAVDNPDYLIKDIGGYNPLLGMSYNEIGTIARSQHKCQGFGAVIERGSREEYFQHLGGEKLNESFFEKNHRSWDKMVGSELNAEFETLLENFNFLETEKNVEALFSILSQLEKLPESYFKEEKVKRCKQIILDCLGTHISLLGEDYSFVPEPPVPLTLSIVNRSSQSYYLESVRLSTGEMVQLNDTLMSNLPYENKLTSNGKVGWSTPYWLRRPFENTFDIVSNFTGAAQNDPSISAQLRIRVGENILNVDIPAIYKWRDPSYGERERPLISTPLFTANFEQDNAILKAGESRKIRLRVHSFTDSLSEVITVKASDGWILKESKFPVSINTKHGEELLEIELTASKNASEYGTLELFIGSNSQVMNFTEISYDHIPSQVIFLKSELKCVRLDAEIKKGRVAYINGIEDAVPQAIEALGFEVDVLEVADLATTDLSSYQSVVLGIRIYNVHPELRNYTEKLHEFVFKGGNLVMQYNTASRSGSNEFGPKPFKLSRNRVTEEDAEVTLLEPDHAILSYPNKITEEDFENWVQERGLYFAGDWDESYTPIISWADQGEDPVLGGLIVTEHGEGRFVYTGISFFRELPNGVVGAYRLFANLLSYKP